MYYCLVIADSTAAFGRPPQSIARLTYRNLTRPEKFCTARFKIAHQVVITHRNKTKMSAHRGSRYVEFPFWP